ncbi:hypothetical protein [uncultured Aquimarina sp.]|uniref:hypothetical protein n=1 Tax=uncultured Aquimarina sp. TaxID=575652 RepID=UPI00261FF910|nr:hypothetical protein [uncultured Aquimarina sp.]
MFKKNLLSIKLCSALIIVLLSLLGCKSHKEIKKLASQVECKKTIYFIWDDESNVFQSEKRGNYKEGYTFRNIDIDYKELFIESIEKINNDYEGTYIYGKYSGFPSDSVIEVRVKLEKLVWHLNFSKSKRDLQLLYSTPNKDFQFLGKSKRKKHKAMLESFEHGNLKFILAACNN